MDSPNAKDMCSQHNNSNSPTSSEFRIDFSGWECGSDSQAGLNYMGIVPIDYFGAGYEFSPSPDDYTGKVKKPRRSRLYCRRGAVVLQSSPLGKGWQQMKKLHMAVNSSDYKAVCAVLEDGGNACAADDKHRTALHIAAAKGTQDIVQVLLKYGANPNLKDVIGNTPLHLAVCSNNIGCITLLLKGGANAHALDRNGRTPLHLAHSTLTRTQSSYYTSQQLRSEVSEIIGMLKMYMCSMGFDGEVDQLNKLGNKLEETTTKEGVDEIQEMLVGFTNMSIEKQSKTADPS